MRQYSADRASASLLNTPRAVDAQVARRFCAWQRCCRSGSWRRFDASFEAIRLTTPDAAVVIIAASSAPALAGARRLLPQGGRQP